MRKPQVSSQAIRKKNKFNQAYNNDAAENDTNQFVRILFEVKMIGDRDKQRENSQKGEHQLCLMTW